MNGISYLVLHGDENTEITDISCDSRRVEPGFAFVCLKGSDYDGHDYIEEAAAKGAAAVIVSAGKKQRLADGCCCALTVLFVTDGWSAYAVMSANYFGNPSRELTMIGITGTKGKTTVCHMLGQILETAGIPAGMIGTNGAFWGTHHELLPNTTPDAYCLHKLLRRMCEDGCTHVVMEVSSQGLKQHRTDTITFACAVFTNISNDHIGKKEHKDFDEYLYWKSRLFCQCGGCSVLNADDRHTERLLELSDAAQRSRILWYGGGEKARSEETGGGAYFDGVKYRIGADGTPGMDYRCRIWENKLLRHTSAVRVNMPGLFHVYNSMAAYVCASALGCEEAAVLEGIAKTRVRGRTEVVHYDGHITVMIDYAHNAVSAEQVLQTIRACHNGRIVCIFGCGGGRSRLRRFSMGEMCGRYADFSIITEDNSRYEPVERIMEDIVVGMEKAGGEYICIPDRRTAIVYALDFAKDGDFIVLLGKGHEDYMEVNGTRVHFSEHEIIENYFGKGDGNGNRYGADNSERHCRGGARDDTCGESRHAAGRPDD